MVGPAVRAIAFVAVWAAAVLVAGCAADQAPGSSSSAGPGKAAEAAAESAGLPGIRVAGVVPRAVGATWSGTTVIVDYQRGSDDVVVGRCRLVIDGMPTAARVTWTAFGPAAFAIVFTWSRPYVRGAHTFEVTLPLATGDLITCVWVATRS
jgi:hypothetical protein